MNTLNDLCHFCDEEAVMQDVHGRFVCRGHGRAKPPSNVKSPRPNESCVCGSGKKYKKCCRKRT